MLSLDRIIESHKKISPFVNHTPLISSELLSKKVGTNDIYVCGGGRKNKSLINLLKKKIINNIFSIDHLNIDGDFIESQAFGYLGIRSYLGLPISFPETTGCKNPSTGGEINKNF